MKYKIEKNNVQETWILSLYSRKLCKEEGASSGKENNHEQITL
mgnify:CR=1 FL=1